MSKPDADPDVKRLEIEKERQRLINAYHRIFESADGKMVLLDLMQSFGTDKPAFLQQPDGGYSATHAAIRDGQRSVLLHVTHKLSLPCNGDANIEKAKGQVIKS